MFKIITSTLLVLAVPATVFAIMQSPNYKIDYETLTPGGGVEGSANYKMMETLGEIGEGKSESPSYQVGGAMNYGIQADQPPTPTLLNTGSYNSLNFRINRGYELSDTDPSLVAHYKFNTDPLIDSYTTTGVASETVDATNTKIAQKFQAGSFTRISAVDLYQTAAGNLVGDIRVETDSTGSPSGTLVYADAYANNVTLNAGSTTHIPLNAISVVTAGMEYWIVFSRDSGSGTFQGNTAGEADQVKYYDGSWHYSANVESLYFKVQDQALDWSDTGNDGKVVGPVTADGRFGRALQFDGTNDYVEVADDSSLDITSAITIEAWAKDPPDTLTIQPSGKDTYLLEDSPTSNYGSSTYLRLNNGPSYHTVQSILEFGLSGLPAGATLTSASLQLYYYGYDFYNPVGDKTWAYKLTRTNWVELQATWNIYKTGSNWTTAGGDYVTSNPSGGSTTFPASPNAWMTWNVLAIAQDAFGAGVPAEFLVKFETGQSQYSYTYFYSNNYTTDPTLQPKLVITYTPPPPKTIVSKGQNAYSLEMSADGSTLYGYINSTEISTSVSTPLEWHHYALTYDGSNQKLYIDGVLVNSAALAGAIPANATDLKIGEKFSGPIDEVGVYNRAKTAYEISRDAQIDNPEDAEYAIAMSDDNWATTQYIQVSNNLGNTMAWQTYANWGNGTGETVTGLEAVTEYKMKAKARDEDFTETDWSSETSAETSDLSMSFSIDKSWIDLGTLIPNQIGSGSHLLTTSTNGEYGYVVTIQEDGNLRLGDGLGDIDDVTDGSVSMGEEYGVRTSGSAEGQMSDQDYAITSNLQTIASSTGPVDPSVVTVTYKVVIDPLTNAGKYSHIVTYICTTTF